MKNQHCIVLNQLANTQTAYDRKSARKNFIFIHLHSIPAATFNVFRREKKTYFNLIHRITNEK